MQSLAQRVKRDPALLARALADPGLRSKLPDSFLTPTQRAQRHHNQFVNDIGDLNTPLAGRSLVNAAQQATDSEFNPLFADIGRQEGTVQRRTGAQQQYAKGYYDTLDKLLGSIVGQQGGANTAATSAAQGATSAATGAIDAADAQARQRAAADAAVRGAGLQGDSLEQLAAATAAQKAQATTEGQRAQQAASNFGQAQSAFLNGIRASGGQAGGELQGQIGARGDQALNDLAAERTKLRAQREGQFTDTLLKLRQNEMTNAFTQAGLGLNTAKANASIAGAASSRAETRRHNRAMEKNAADNPSRQKTQAELDFFRKHGYWPPTGPPKSGRGGRGGSGGSGGGWAPDTQQAAAQSAVAGGLDVAKQLMNMGWTRDKIVQALSNGQKGQQVFDPKTGAKALNPDGTPKMTRSLKAIDPIFAAVAADVAEKGYLTPRDVQMLHERGIRVSAIGYPSERQYRSSPRRLPPGGRQVGGTAGL